MLLKRKLLVKLDDQILIDVSVRRVVLFSIKKQFSFRVHFIGYPIDWTISYLYSLDYRFLWIQIKK